MSDRKKTTREIHNSTPNDKNYHASVVSYHVLPEMKDKASMLICRTYRPETSLIS